MLHWSLVRLAHCLLVIALNYVYYFEQINMMMMMTIITEAGCLLEASNYRHEAHETCVIMNTFTRRLQNNGNTADRRTCSSHVVSHVVVVDDVSQTSDTPPLAAVTGDDVTSASVVAGDAGVGVACDVITGGTSYQQGHDRLH